MIEQFAEGQVGVALQCEQPIERHLPQQTTQRPEIIERQVRDIDEQVV
jgi:hypothetical protein